MIANLNKALYYWDMHLATGERDYLSGAWQFMRTYREQGGTEYRETEKAIENAVLAKQEDPECK